ncbi:MAG: peptidoglycan-binding domain-containing protein, partial [Planctomycetota bacterium]
MSSTGAIGVGQPLPFPDGDASTGTSSGAAPGRFAGNPELAQVASGNATLERGARGPHATLVQEALIGVGYEMPRWGADGSFGAETETAVLAFQRDAGLAETGAIDAETLECLAASAEGLQPRGPFVGNAELRQVALGAATLANGSRGESARLVQQALADAGFDPQGVDGWIGQNTLAAVADLQQQAGLPQTGTVDAATLTALEARIGQAPIDEPEPTDGPTGTDGVTPGTTTSGSAA